MRLIDAEQMALAESAAYRDSLARIDDVNLLCANRLVHAKVQKIIAVTPTVDAVPVVRCRNCRYYTSHICCHPGGMRYTCDSDYCSRAEFLCNQSADVRKMEGQPDEEP